MWSEDSGVVPLRSFQGVCKVKIGFIIILRYGLPFHSFSHEFSMDYMPEVMSLLQWRIKFVPVYYCIFKIFEL